MHTIARKLKQYDSIKKNRIVNIVVWLTVIIVAGLLFGYSDIKISCPLYYFTNIQCPLCGATRACRSILHGDIYKAFNYNQLLVASLPFIFVFIVYECIYYINTGYFKRIKWLTNITIVLGILFFIIRNLMK